MPTSLSPYPNLEQLKKQAKDLRKAHAAGSPEAAKRLKVYVGRFSDLGAENVLSADLALRDAQHVIAREHGFAGWQDMLEVVSPKDAPTFRQLVADSVDYSEDELLPVQLQQVEILERDDGRDAAVVLRGDHDRIIVMCFGDFAGLALLRRIKGGDWPRPLTHDLFSQCLGLLGGVVTAVVIHELRHNAFLAHVVLEVDGERTYLDARPSDGLNLAARQSIPIYVTPSLMEKAGQPLSELSETLEKARAPVDKSSE